jgi:hypothetical protein
VIARSGTFPGEEVVEAGIWPEIDETAENVGKVAIRIDAAELAGLDQRSNDGPVLRAVVVAGEECVLARESHHPFILPMSGRSWKSITAGIPTLAARSSSGA